MDQPGAELARDVVACPGADTCNLAVTQSRGLGAASATRSRPRAWPRSAGCASTSRAAPTAAASTTPPTSASSAPSAGPTAARPRLPDAAGRLRGRGAQSTSARRRCACRQGGPEATVRVVRRFADERVAGESFREWMDRGGRGQGLGAELKELDVFPTPEEGPEFYVDYDETGPYEAEVGSAEGGECGVGVGMSFLVEPPALPVPQLHDEELAELNAEFEGWPAPKIIQWASTPSRRTSAWPPRCRTPSSSTWPPRSTRPSRSSSSTPATTSPRRSRPSRRCASATASTSG